MSPAELEIGAATPALLLALLLGLRHATDPDHLAALITLAADPERGGARAAAGLGLAWGLGHAATCFGLGLAVVWLGSDLPPALRLGAELAVGLLIVVLALRLLHRWRRGRFHSHPHRHGDVEHSHPHLHEPAGPDHSAGAHRHAHVEGLGRSPGEALGIGLVHGVGGSALGAALLVAAAGDPVRALVLLGCFCGGTVVAMACVSAGLGLAFDRAPRALRLERAAPVVGMLTLGFGAGYAALALSRLIASS